MKVDSEQYFDTVIVGQGLAGTLLAWALVDRDPGRRILLVDREEAVTSSRVAAGIVTPITGQRLVKSWRLEEMSGAAEEFYRRVEKTLRATFFREKPILRFLKNELEVERWQRRVDEADYGNWLRESDGNVTGVRDDFGAFEMRGWQLDVPGFLDASRAWFVERGMYRAGEVAASASAIDVSEDVVAVRELGVTAGELVFCQGWRANEGDLFDWVPFRPGKGELMEVEMAEGSELETGGRIVNRGGWLLPLEGQPLRYRCGSTYSWDRVDCVPTAEGRADLEAKLRGMLKPGVEFSVVDQSAAVRPVIRESRALMGRHPGAGMERVGFFNGLGSKGVLNGPFFAAQLAGHLVDGAEIEEELDLRRNL